jgi:hypothetical protein
LEEDENGLILKIINLRAYSSAYSNYINDPKNAKGPAVERVKAIELELAGINLKGIK